MIELKNISKEHVIIEKMVNNIVAELLVVVLCIWRLLAKDSNEVTY